MIAYQTKRSWQGGLGLYDVEVPVIGPGQALVKLNYASLNRRDYKIKEGWYFKDYTFDAILGSDGCGVVTDVFNKKDSHWIGKEVIINPNVLWGSNDKIPSEDYTVLGMPTDGTLAEYIVVNEDRIFDKPMHLSPVEAAALPLASLTAYRAIFKKSRLRSEHNILITGAGGGVAQMAIKFALAVGANVYVTSGDDTKIQKVRDWGVIDGVNYHEDYWKEDLLSKVKNFDVILDSSGGDYVNKLLLMLKQGGRYVFYGATSGLPKQFNLNTVYYNQLQVIGTMMGSDTDFSCMLDFVTQHKLAPEIEAVISLGEINNAFELLKNRSQFGKVVIKTQICQP